MDGFSELVIDLQPIFKFIGRPENAAIPRRDEEAYIRYRDVADGLLREIPRGPGWYAWFADDRQADAQRAKYIGQSATYGLFNRLREELREDYLAFWGTKYDVQQMLHEMTRMYPKYRSKHRCVANRAGTTHILVIGCADATRGELDVMEYKLIQEFTPPGNTDVRDYSRVCVPVYQPLLSIFQKHLL